MQDYIEENQIEDQNIIENCQKEIKKLNNQLLHLNLKITKLNENDKVELEKLKDLEENIQTKLNSNNKVLNLIKNQKFI